MRDLSAHQSMFYENCFINNSHHSAKLIVPLGISGDERLNIYKNNTFISLSEALSSTFPTVHKLVGGDFFSYCACEFIKKFPPSPGPLFEYGSEFSSFLGSFEPAGSIHYLSDVARLDWAMNVAFHAADAEPITADELVNISEQQLVKLRLKIHPSCQILSSNFPVDKIWRANNVTDEFAEINLDQASKLIVLRPQEIVILLEIDESTLDFIVHIQNGENVEQALSNIVKINPEFNAAKTLVELITAGVFTDFTLPIN